MFKFLETLTFNKPNLLMIGEEGTEGGGSGGFGAEIPAGVVPQGTPPGWTPPPAVTPPAQAGSLTQQLKQEETTSPEAAAPVTPEQPSLDPAIASLFKEHDHSTVATVTQVFAPYFAGKADEHQAAEALMQADRGLGSNLFYAMLKRYESSPVLAEQIKEHFPNLAKNLGVGAAPTAPATPQAPRQPSAPVIVPQTGTLPDWVLDTETGEPNPAYLQIYNQMQANEAALARAQKELADFKAKSEQMTAEQIQAQAEAKIVTQEQSVIREVVTSSLDVAKLDAFTSQSLVNNIGTAIDNDAQLKRYEADWKSHIASGNNYQAQQSERLASERVKSLVAVQVSALIANIKASNSHLLAAIKAQSPQAMRQPNPTQGLPPGFNPSQLAGQAPPATPAGNGAVRRPSARPMSLVEQLRAEGNR